MARVFDADNSQQQQPKTSVASSRSRPEVLSNKVNGGSVSDGEKESGFLRRIVGVCTLGSFLFGYDTGVINGALPFMKVDLGLTPVGYCFYLF